MNEQSLRDLSEKERKNRGLESSGSVAHLSKSISIYAIYLSDYVCGYYSFGQ